MQQGLTNGLHSLTVAVWAFGIFSGFGSDPPGSPFADRRFRSLDQASHANERMMRRQAPLVTTLHEQQPQDTRSIKKSKHSFEVSAQALAMPLESTPSDAPSSLLEVQTAAKLEEEGAHDGSGLKAGAHANGGLELGAAEPAIQSGAAASTTVEEGELFVAGQLVLNIADLSTFVADPAGLAAAHLALSSIAGASSSNTHVTLRCADGRVLRSSTSGSAQGFGSHLREQEKSSWLAPGRVEIEFSVDPGANVNSVDTYWRLERANPDDVVQRLSEEYGKLAHLDDSKPHADVRPNVAIKVESMSFDIGVPALGKDVGLSVRTTNHSDSILPSSRRLAVVVASQSPAPVASTTSTAAAAYFVKWTFAIDHLNLHRLAAEQQNRVKRLVLEGLSSMCGLQVLNETQVTLVALPRGMPPPQQNGVRVDVAVDVPPDVLPITMQMSLLGQSGQAAINAIVVNMSHLPGIDPARVAPFHAMVGSKPRASIEKHVSIPLVEDSETMASVGPLGQIRRPEELRVSVPLSLIGFVMFFAVVVFGLGLFVRNLSGSSGEKLFYRRGSRGGKAEKAGVCGDAGAAKAKASFRDTVWADVKQGCPRGTEQ